MILFVNLESENNTLKSVIQIYRTVLINDQRLKIQEAYSHAFIKKTVHESLYLSKVIQTAM